MPQHAPLFEYAKNKRSLSPKEVRLLNKYNRQMRKKTGDEHAYIARYEEFGQLETFNYVGVLQLGKRRIEILPKLYRKTADSEATLNLARGNLFRMLTFCKKIQLMESEISHYAKTADFFEFLIQYFLSELQEAIENSLHQEYVETRDDLPALRGKWNITRQFTILMNMRHKLSCEFDEFTADNLLNRIIKATLRKLKTTSSFPANRTKIEQFLTFFDEVEDVAIEPHHFVKIKLNRLNLHYEHILAFCKQILLEGSLLPKSDKGKFVALIYDMNELFEEYIGRLLRKKMIPGYSVELQNPWHLAQTSGGKSVIGIRPDIVILKNRKETTVLDTKYKLSLAKDGNPNSNDMYQMLGYACAKKCSNVFLIYPNLPDRVKFEKNKSYTIKTPNGDDIHIHCIVVDLFDETGKLDPARTSEQIVNNVNRIGWKNLPQS